MADLDARAFIKRGKSLVPADTHAEEFLDAIKDGREVLVTIRQPRHPEFHRFFFAKLKAICDATGRWHHVDDLLEDLKLATRHTIKKINAITGEQYVTAKSISFAAMGQDRFAQFNDRCDYVLAEAGIDTVTIMRESKIDVPKREK